MSNICYKRVLLNKLNNLRVNDLICLKVVTSHNLHIMLEDC